MSGGRRTVPPYRPGIRGFPLSPYLVLIIPPVLIIPRGASRGGFPLVRMYPRYPHPSPRLKLGPAGPACHGDAPRQANGNVGRPAGIPGHAGKPAGPPLGLWENVFAYMCTLRNIH